MAGGPSGGAGTLRIGRAGTDLRGPRERAPETGPGRSEQRDTDDVDAVIAVSGLVKRFGRFTALDRLDLRVDAGEVHGFLGPNGSGKSTTIRILLGLLRADAGSVSVLGRDPWRDAVALHERLAYVPGEVSLWPNLTGGEVIDLLARMRGGIDEARRAELLERFGLDPTKQCRSYSKGNQAEALSATPLVAMTAVAALLLGAGLVGLRRRDLR